MKRKCLKTGAPLRCLVFTIVTACFFARPVDATPVIFKLVSGVNPPHLEDFRGPGRDRWQMPDQVLAALHLKKANTIADIGAGTGYFSLLFAKAVGPRGRVVAVDIDSRALEYLKRQARKENLTNIETVVSRPDDPLLAPGSIDLAFFCDTVHEIGGRVDYYRKVHRALKNGGRLAVIDSLPAVNSGGQGEGSQVPRELTAREAQDAGFKLIAEPKFLPRQYFLIFQRAGRASQPAQGAKDR